MAKTPQLLPKQGIPVSYPKLTFKPIFGSLSATICSCPFYKYVSLSFMVLYQLELLNLVDYNLIYSKNKNRGFDKVLAAFPLKTKHFLFYKHSSKPIQTNTKTHLQPKQKTFIHIWGFPQPKHERKGVRVYFLTFESLDSLTPSLPSSS